MILPTQFWYYPVVIAAVSYGAGNAIAHALQKTTQKRQRLSTAGLLGAVTGALIGAFAHFIGLVPVVGNIIQYILIYYSFLQLFIGFIGFLFAVYHRVFLKESQAITKSLKIFMGLYYLDESFTLRSIIHGFSRHTWELLQTFVGHFYSQIRNTGVQVSMVEYFGGNTFIINENQNYQDGISLGNFLNINLWRSLSNAMDLISSHEPILLHEHGHTIDSRRFGWLYLPVIGLPSLINAMGKGNHNVFWTEIRANRNVKKYAEKYYHVSWKDYESEYPTA
ncbi:MAG: hypothetical protein J6T67_01835 [Paludibacteraceae bacterium]|nr:hypothetical protein [Paludibacteraceae bacterium]